MVIKEFQGAPGGAFAAYGEGFGKESPKDMAFQTAALVGGLPMKVTSVQDHCVKGTMPAGAKPGQVEIVGASGAKAAIAWPKAAPAKQ